MKEDKLKSFIQNNAEEFHAEKPSNNLWSGIADQLPEAKPEVRMIPVRSAWKAAISVAAVFAAVIFALQYSDNSSPQLAEQTVEQTEFSDVSQLESYYASQVNDRIERLKMYEVDEELLEEIAFLKEEFETLKNEADKGVNTEDILDSMIDNYRMRVSILEEIMREVQQKSETTSHEVEQ
ncbi:MAG: hypothetical protein AB8B53_00475 [Flavobacteriales bacterium]